MRGFLFYPEFMPFAFSERSGLLALSFGHLQRKYYYASSLCYLDGSLYFLNGYYFGGITNVLGDAHTYRLDLSTGTLTKLD